MISNMKSASGGDVMPRQEQSKTSATDWLSFAAAPTFAVMALLTSVLGGKAPDAICTAAHASLFGGMVPMYLLMSAFHATPWLKLMSRWR